MKQHFSTNEDNRSQSRKRFSKKALGMYYNQAPIILRTINISYSDIYVISPRHMRRKAVCLLKLSISIDSEESQTFDVKARVISSIYSSQKNGFIQGLEFLKIEKKNASINLSTLTI